VPIFTDAHCFTHYQPRAIDAGLLQALRGVGQGLTYSINATLLRLECYLQITRQTLTLSELDSPHGQAKLKRFIGALFSGRFEGGNRTSLFAEATRLRALFQGVGAMGASAAMAAMTTRWKNSGELRSSIEEFENTDLDQERVSLWRGWPAQSRVGQTYHYELHAIHERFGAAFADQFYAAICHWQHGHINHIPLINSFAGYLGECKEEINFGDSRLVSSVVRSFLVSELKLVHRNGLQIEAATGQARNLIGFLEGHVFGKSWSEPLPRVPKPTKRGVPGHKTHVRKTSEGHEVKYSLVTQIPLQVTDAEAMETLFAAVRKDVDVLLRWARAEVVESRQRIQRRKALAPSGIVRRFFGISNKGLRAKSQIDNCPEYLAHAAATFESCGFSHLFHGKRAWVMYPSPLPETTWQLGIPTPKLLLAYAALLVAAHPKITSSFLRTLELFDKDEKLAGFVETDSGHFLIGDKLRRGASLAQQRVLLNFESIQVVRDIIQATAPLREHLRKAGDDAWRKLFLCTKSLGWTPKCWRPVQAANECVEWLTDRLVTLLRLEQGPARSLAQRFSLARLRSSAGVLVYLETGSVQRMAEALGHQQWSPSLLDHYLPKPIQEFFVQRWIRLFQTGIICEVLKDSPLLLRASSFDTMEELDEFLKKHALRRMPAHLENPDSLPEVSSDSSECIVFGLETGILTLLLSLELAVDAAPTLPGVLALRWARMCKYLIAHLEAQQEQPEFHEMVRIARQHADPLRMSKIIYE
jgi:hypothetical protein